MKKRLILLLFTLCLCGCSSGGENFILGEDYYVADGEGYTRAKLIGRAVGKNNIGFCLLFYSDSASYRVRVCNPREGQILKTDKIVALT